MAIMKKTRDKNWCFSAISGVNNLPQCRRHRRHMFHPWVGRSSGEGNGNPLQYFCLGNFMDRGAWWAIAHKVPKSWT